MFIQGVTLFVTDDAYRNDTIIKCILLSFNRNHLVLHGTLEDLNNFKNQLEEKIKMEEKKSMNENIDLKEDELPEDQVVTEVDPDEDEEELTDLSDEEDEEDEDEEEED